MNPNHSYIDNHLAKLGAQYHFTSYGDVYAGFEFDLPFNPGNVAIIQNDHLMEFSTLSDTEKTAEKIRKCGWLVPKAVIIDRKPYGDIIKPLHQDYGTSFNSLYSRKDMFIFGAGASSFCGTKNTLKEFLKSKMKPPLGNELFASRYRDIYRKYDGVRQSIMELQDKDVNVEEFLEEEWKEVENGNVVIMNRHINIQYYLQEILKVISNHICEEYFDANLFTKLAYKLQVMQGREPNRKFAIVSFNQDTILDTFFTQQFKTTISSFEDYVDVNNRPFVLFKPHGSWNWGWKFPKEIPNVCSWLHNNNTNFHQLYYQLLGTPENMIDWNSFGVEAANHEHRIGRFTIDKSRLQLIDPEKLNNYYPGILLPYRDKDELTFPLKHYHCLTGYLNEVENLYIIGWKGNEKVFNKLLTTHANKLKKIVIADPNPTVVKDNLNGVLSHRKITLLFENNFDDFVANFSA